MVPINNFDSLKLTARKAQSIRTVIHLNGHQIGNEGFTVIAGPCSIESEEQMHEIAARVAAAGAHILRGGAYKPRTSPYDFQGLGEIGLRYLQAAAKKNNLACVSEVMDSKEIELVAEYVDIVQIGSRNMQNFALLKQLGKINKPILLKRGMSATYLEFLQAAEYILHHGNARVILCERGIRTFESFTRNTLDLAAIPILKELSHLPVLVDPSHGTGLRWAVPTMTYAAFAAGADGVMLEVHPLPEQSVSDAKQTISPLTFQEIMKKIKQFQRVLS